MGSRKAAAALRWPPSHLSLHYWDLLEAALVVKGGLRDAQVGGCEGGPPSALRIIAESVQPSTIPQL